MEWFAVLIIFIVYIIYRNKKDKENERIREELFIKDADTIKSIVSSHITTLVKKQKMLVSKDDYGNFVFDRWNAEIDYFIQNNIVNSPLIIIMRTNQIISTAHKIIIDMVYEYKIQELENPSYIEFNEDMLPNEYEHFCKDLLTNQGLDARVTQQSGDQGVDVIVYNADNQPLVAIQCKLYGTPVGNKAIQEIYTAKQHIGADIAIVVSNNTYTKSARELANTTNVILAHHEDLRDFNKLIDSK